MCKVLNQINLYFLWIHFSNNIKLPIPAWLELPEVRVSRWNGQLASWLAGKVSKVQRRCSKIPFIGHWRKRKTGAEEALEEGVHWRCCRLVCDWNRGLCFGFSTRLANKLWPALVVTLLTVRIRVRLGAEVKVGARIQVHVQLRFQPPLTLHSFWHWPCGWLARSIFA